MAKAKKKKKRISPRTKKRIFQFFERVVLGAIKVWIKNKAGIPEPVIIAADQADEFLKEQIESMPE